VNEKDKSNGTQSLTSGSDLAKQS